MAGSTPECVLQLQEDWEPRIDCQHTCQVGRGLKQLGASIDNKNVYGYLCMDIKKVLSPGEAVVLYLLTVTEFCSSRALD